MADEIVEPSEGGNSRRNLILLGVAAFLAVLLVVAIIFGILFFTGVLSTNEDLEPGWPLWRAVGRSKIMAMKSLKMMVSLGYWSCQIQTDLTLCIINLAKFSL